MVRPVSFVASNKYLLRVEGCVCVENSTCRGVIPFAALIARGIGESSTQS